jgi:GTP-binding protein Era
MYKSCFISIVGKPNAGKSTLLNTLIGEKVSIVSWRPQTTRNIITGVLHGENYQIVFLDTPGIQHGKSLLGEYMAKSVRSASDGADAVLYVVDGAKKIDEDEYRNIERTAASSKIPLVVAVNKTDEADRELLVKNLLRYNEMFAASKIENSALKTENNSGVNSEKSASKSEKQDGKTISSVPFSASKIENSALKIENNSGVISEKYTAKAEKQDAKTEMQNAKNEKQDAKTEKKEGKIISVVPVSALKGTNIGALKKELEGFLKEGEKYYSEGMITDKNLRFLAQEIIREKTLLYLEKEIPHGIGVNITNYIVRDDGIADIEAEIIAVKDSHKPIIIGKGGAMLKKIASAARRDIEKISDEKVFLKVWVKVREDWQDNYSYLKELGYDKKDI